MDECLRVTFVIVALSISSVFVTCNQLSVRGKLRQHGFLDDSSPFSPYLSGHVGLEVTGSHLRHTATRDHLLQEENMAKMPKNTIHSKDNFTHHHVHHEYLMTSEEGKNEVGSGQIPSTEKWNHHSVPEMKSSDSISSSAGNTKLPKNADAVVDDTLENYIRDPIDDEEINDVQDELEEKDKKQRQRQVIAWGFGNQISKLNNFWQKWFSVKRFGQASANLAGQVTNEKFQQFGKPSKEDRLLSLFTFVKFNNTECTSATGDAGLCYTDKECRARGGTASGVCASGFGVCCVFYRTCGAIAVENSTYFVNEGFPETRSVPGRCQMTAVRPNNRVCQLRVDFVNFEIAGPSSDTNNAQIYGQCNTDQFVVTHQTGAITPVICGTNSGQHVYLDFRQGEQLQMIFLIGSGATVGGSRRSWKLRVTQIPCGAPYEAPSGCLQYHLGVTGKIQTFNYNEARGQQLANQDYSVCIRMDNGFCGVLYQQCTDTVNAESESFSISNVNGNFQSQINGECVAGNAGTQDWVSIPCATNVPYSFQNSDDSFCSYRQCGSYLSALSGTAGSTTLEQVYSSQKPFTIYYHTDASDPPPGAPEETLRGFCLDYVQQPCPLTVGRG